MMPPIVKALLLLLNFAAAAPSRSGGDPYCPHFPSISLNEDDANEKKELQRTLNVHICPHTHDDVGWLKTVDQYFYGLNNTIQQAHVSLILDNVLNELQDPHTKHNRTFTYVEMKFFSKWYLTLPPALKNSLKELIKEEKFSFANGGWCMHDEAATHYMGMIDQTSLGHQFLLKELGVVPKVGWQIDPFGHSATQGGLLTSSVGFDALYFGRIHYVDLQTRQAEANCEGLWSSAPDYSSVFWGLTGSYRGNYGAPDNFCFDVLCGDDPLVGLEKDALRDRIKLFTNALGVQANQTKGRNIMLTMGMDFQYSNARKNFQNLDLLIDATRRILGSGEIKVSDFLGDRFDKVAIFYSTPERYTQCKYADLVNSKASMEDEGVPSKYNPAEWKNSSPKGNDFFPYADCAHCWWTGFYTSRQGLKRMERVGSSFLHAARQIESIAKLILPQKRSPRLTTSAWNASPLYELEDAMGVVQHHDGVSGTSKQHVAYDYAKRIAAGMNKANLFVTDALSKLLLNKNGTLGNLSYCSLLNETICSVSQEASKKGSEEDIYIIVYNALAIKRDEVLSLPIDSSSRYIVEQLGEDQSDRTLVDGVVLPNANYAQVTGAALDILYFEARGIPPLGVSVFRITKVENEQLSSASATPAVPRNLRWNDMESAEEEIVITNDILSVSFDHSTGVVKSINNLRDGIKMNVDQQYGFYKSFFKDEPAPLTVVENTDDFKSDGKCLPGYTDVEGNEYRWLIKATADDGQKSGAYIFRPTPDQKLHIIPPEPQSVVTHTDGLVKEVHSVFGEGGWIRQIARLLPGKDFVEIEYVVGPVPIDGGGKEIVSKWTTSVNSDGHFFTDSNGRAFLKRKRSQPNTLEPIAENYYPVNTAIFIEDIVQSFGILVDRSQGGTSLTDGAIELMIQRRTLFDDARGVGEPLNETDVGITPYPPYSNAVRIGKGVIVKGHHRLVIGKGGSGASKMRGMMDQVFSQPHIFVASVASGAPLPFQRTSISMVQSSLPDNIMVVSFISLDEYNTFLLRLGHQYGPDEDPNLSLPVEVDLRTIFPNKKILSLREKTLSANQIQTDWEDRRLRWDCSEEGKSFPQVGLHFGQIVLQPLQIRTFEIVLF